MNDNQHFVIDATLIMELMGYLMAKPMAESEGLVNKLRQLRQANIVQEVVAGE